MCSRLLFYIKQTWFNDRSVHTLCLCFSLGNLQYNTRSSAVYYGWYGLSAFLQSTSALMQGITDVMTATFQLPCLTWNTPCCLKRKLNQWPQSNYISRPAGYPCVCFQCGYCVRHKGILPPPSWSYQSLAELRGVGKVIHTTGGSIHTADSPQRCLLCLFNSSQASKDSAEPLSSVLHLPYVLRALFHKWGDSVEVRGRSRPQWHFFFLHFNPWARSRDREWLRQAERKDCTECPQLHHYLLGCLCPHVELAHSASLL